MIPVLDTLPPMPWAHKLAYLTYRFSLLDNVECPLTHHFDGNAYVREIAIPAGTLFIGRIHRYGHRVELVLGSGVLVTATARLPISAPYAIETTPQGQVAFYATSDVVGRTYHPNPTDSRDTQALEDDIFESVESLVALGRVVEERLEYALMMTRHGVDEEALRPLIEDESDQIPFPHPVPVNVAPSAVHGQGIVATAGVESGETIAPARVGGRRTPAGRYTNHSIRPNARMVNVAGDVMLVATQGIPPGTEVTVDYRQAVQAGVQS